jgi:hypothetical protein
MTLYYTVKWEVKITMVEYLKGVIGDLPQVIDGTAPTAAPENLFDVWPDEERVLLEEERARAFHHAVAQLLFTSSRAHKDIQLAVSFRTTRVKHPYEDDWNKLKRLLEYIHGTIYMPLILRADSLSIIKWWVVASYATHGDCRGHTGAMMSLGRGSIIGMSKKQKSNTKSSSECELVGVDDASTQMLWKRSFIEGQGYNIEASILNQDNLSSILLKKNGRASSSKRTKHINVWYFFIKDRIASGELTVKCWPITLRSRYKEQCFKHSERRYKEYQLTCLMQIWAGTDHVQLMIKKRTCIAPAHRSVLAHIKIVPTLTMYLRYWYLR